MQAMQQHSLEWRKSALSTEPLLKQPAAEAVSQAYSAAGIKPPSRWIWVDSPLAGAIAAEALSGEHTNVGRIVIKDRVLEFLHAIESRKKEFDLDYYWRNLRPSTDDISELIARQVDRGLGVLSRTGSLAIARARFNFDWQGTYERISDQLTSAEQHKLPKKFSSVHSYESSSRWTWCVRGGLEPDLLAPFAFALSQHPPLPNLQCLTNIRRYCGWWWPFEGICVMSERPRVISLDEMGQRLHNEDGPALVFSDKWKIFARRGSIVSRRVIQFKKRKDIMKIQYESNAETRRHMIEIYGYEEYIREIGAKILALDEYGCLLRVNFGHGEEPLVLLRVNNSTAEPDGSYKNYYLRVPPNMRSPREAVAWTFNMDIDTYCPVVET